MKSFFSSLKRIATSKEGTTDDLETQLRNSFDAAYYLSHYHDVRQSGLDPYEHYMNYGWREKRRPNGWFDPNKYPEKYPDLMDADTNPLAHFITHKDLSDEALLEQLKMVQENRVLYWADMHRRNNEGEQRALVLALPEPRKEDIALVASKFDPEYYLEENPDLKTTRGNLLIHFMTIGWLEGRNPNANFSVNYYLEQNGDIQREGINPFVHYLKTGYREKWRRFSSVKGVEILNRFVEGTPLAEKVAAAKALDPMVAMPNVARKVTSPLLAVADETDSAKAIRIKLAGKTYRYIVLVPHVRMSGASRVASIFADALAQVRDPSDILVVTTDSSEAEYIGWFSDKLDIFDLSAEIKGLGEENKMRAMIDLMRGVGCQTVINVNSRLMWESMRTFGRQLHHEFRICTYLFTWEETADGDRVGYPIQWLRDTADHHHLLLTDSKNLADDVADRLGFEQEGDAAQVKWLHTPVTGSTATTTPPQSRTAGRFLWAGRFDPQKRVDLLVDIARANPNMTFDVYGKLVLGSKDLAAYDPPENINHLGTYTDLQDVLDTPYSGFLYTAQWDGIPTILLDMAAAGLPIVAPDVGGIRELLDDTTGWLIPDFEDVDAYSAALGQMARNSDDAQARAAHLQTRLADRFTLDGYVDSIKKLVTSYDL